MRGPFFSIILLSLIHFNISLHLATHPLDSLSQFELYQVQTLIKIFHQDATFQYVGLDEPDKEMVLSWQLGNPYNTFLVPRRAFVIARVDSKSHEILVDLKKNAILSDNVYYGNGYPTLNNEEQAMASELPHKYEPFKASIAKRGLDLSKVLCEAFTIGWYGVEINTKRVVQVMCYYLDGTINFYMRPIEGVKATVDLDEMKIVDYSDRMMVPIPKGDGTDYRESKQNPPFDTRIKGILRSNEESCEVILRVACCNPVVQVLP